MRSSPEGLVPARGFLNAGMKPRPSFNDGSSPGENAMLLSIRDSPANGAEVDWDPRPPNSDRIAFELLRSLGDFAFQTLWLVLTDSWV